ncbi:uncharacterized protein LOC112984442 [Dromaius novaehollandiae]|uniref:uncharacterized protein LOC112984442 n=1 Tax=Dromaius novaehollandiae TaxID=8790 RepID=UPI00311EFF46
MAAQKAGSFCEEIGKLFDLLEVHRSRPSLLGPDSARDHWFQLQSVVDQIAAEAVVASLQVAVTPLQEQLREIKRAQEEERQQGLIVKEELRNQLLREADTLAETEGLLEEKGVRQIYPQRDLKRLKGAGDGPPHMCPLVKTEYIYEDDSHNCPQVVTKEIPFTATELAKLRKDFARMARESETEYVWRASPSGGGNGILLVEKEAEGYWGPGVFLMTGDRQAPWSLAQRAAYWASGGLNPLERRDPLAITGSVNQLLESIQKAACLQMMYDRELKPNLSSPVLLPVDPERMTPLIRGLPDSLKPIGIHLQGKIQNVPHKERIAAALEGMVTPEHRWLGEKVWTWGEIGQELINYGRKYGPVGRTYQKVETRAMRVAEPANKLLAFSGRSLDLAKKERSLTRQELWKLGLQKSMPRDLMDGLPTKKLGLLIQRWSSQGSLPRPNPPSAPALNVGEEFEGDEKGSGKLDPLPPQGEGRGRGWMFIRQLTCNNKGDLLITIAVGPKKRPVTFLIDTGAQITMLKWSEAERCGISVPSKHLIVLNALGKTQTVPVTLVTLWLPGEESPVDTMVAVGPFQMNLLGIDVLKGKQWRDTQGNSWSFGVPQVRRLTGDFGVAVRLLQVAPPLPPSQLTNVKP